MDVVAKWLTEFAKNNTYKTYKSLYGSFSYAPEGNKHCGSYTQAVGATYGIWAKLNKKQLNALFCEIQAKGKLNPKLSTLATFKPIPNKPEWYPIYWGKDINAGSRLRAHARGHKNGNIDIFAYEVLRQGVDIRYGVVLVTNYQKFESLLYAKVPPLIGTGSRGKKATYIKVLS